MHRPSAGFTLTELLIAAAASLILSGLTFAGLVMFQQMSQRRAARETEEVELQRALDFMAGDIQEGSWVDDTVPPLGGYRGLFRIHRPNAPDIGYYLAKDRDRVWAGPWIIYRRDFDQERTYALVDGIADQLTSEQLDKIRQQAQLPSNCTDPVDAPNKINIVESDAGFMAIVEDKTKVTLCLVGNLPDSADRLTASIEATTRSR